ncbi:hypothetical protein P8452_41981 [Trifolium repens]|nr:hypothetical protein P8452_41981 [Trifolium repens]
MTVVLDDSFGQQHKDLSSKVARGDYIENIINSNSDVRVTSRASGRTLLHIAVFAGNVDNAKMLIKKGRERLLLMQDKDGNTALSLVARYTGNTDMAKCMIETKHGSGEKLLEIQNKENIFPILMAAANGHRELTTYLYSQTLPKSKLFEETDSQYRILLLSLCITAEIFDVALKLLIRYKDLPKESLSLYNFSVPKLLREPLSLPNKILELDSNQQPIPNKFLALVALAKLPSAFPSGNQFNRREQFIYDILSVEKEFKDMYHIPDISNFVQMVTHIAIDDNERPQRILSVGWFGFGTRILNYLLFVMCFGWRFFKLLFSMFLVWPVKLLGVILLGIAYMFIQSFKFLNIFGVRRLYNMKYSHYEVIGILSYFCQSIREFNDLQLKEASAYEGMLHGAQHGIIEFINAMRMANPEFLSAVDSCHRGIFSYAILHPQLGHSSDRYTRSGAALQMQREIQWFKALEDLVNPRFKEAKNVDGMKPYELFTENHEELVKAG